MSLDRVIHGVRLVDAGTITDRAWVAFDGGLVAATGTGEGWRDLAPREAHDGRGAYLTPGFIDLHGHGGAGFSFDEGPEAIAAARALHRAHGTTRAVISLVTAPLDELATRAAMVAAVAEADPTVLGSHLEGPFLDLDHKGAHTASLLRTPDAASIDLLLEAGRGTIRQVTLAPERAGAMDAITRLVDAGVIAAIGHTSADFDTAVRAFERGARILTHAFNAMRGIHHRAPGPVVAALGDERVTLEIIADGVHVHPGVIRMAMDAAPGRVALVTDAMAAAGAGDGHYDLGGLAVTVADGVARLDEGGAIAGSTLTQDAALRTVVRECGVPLATAVAAATSTPARVLGLGERAGAMRPGFWADAVLMDEHLVVEAVWVAGLRT